MRLRKKIALLIALVITVSIPVSYFLWLRYGVFIYERSIIRKPSDLQEAMALAVAEYSNYSDIFGMPRLTQIIPDDALSFIWANFIDADVIQYYNDRFDNLTGGKPWDKPKEIKFRYEADVFTWDQIRVVYVPAPEGTSSYYSKIQVQSTNGSVLFENPAYGRFVQWNGSNHQKINASDIDFFLSKSYVVKMEFEYIETWGPLAVLVARVNQLIFVDEDFVAVLLRVRSIQVMS